MSSSILDPKLYEAARTGNIQYFRDHALRSDAERTAFDTIPNSTQVNVNLEVPADQEAAANQEEQAHQDGTANPDDQRLLLGVTCGGDTVLHIAVRFGQTMLAKKIYQVRASLLAETNDKWETPLHYAAQYGKHDLVMHFFSDASEVRNNTDLGELLRARNREGETALYQAVRHRHEDVVKELMRADSDLASIPNYKSISPLYLASSLELLPIVTCLCELLPQNVPREAYSGPDGKTALHAAASSKRSLQTILEKMDLTRATDNSGNTPLHYAAIKNNRAAAKMLLEKDRASAYIANSDGLYPVHVAAKLGHKQMVIELFKQCPDSTELLDSQGKNFLHLAVEAKREGVVKWVNENIAKLENAINAQDESGNTPLHLAVRAGDPCTAFRLLLSKKVHLNWVNNDELTPLDIAFAQVKSGFLHPLNPYFVMYNTLRSLGCTSGSRFSTRSDAESDKKSEEDKEKKEMKSCEGMAKSMLIGTVLIASAAFAAAFTVYNIYKGGEDLKDNPQLKLAFHLFFILDAYAFLCSIISTLLLIEAALPFIELRYRKSYLLLCASLVTLAAKCFIVAFTTAAYVVLMPIRKWLAIVIFVVGVFVPLLIQPRFWPNVLVLRTMVKYNVRISKLDVFLQIITLLGNIIYILLLLMVLDGRQSHWRKSKECFPSSSDTYLGVIILYLVLLSFSMCIIMLK